MSEPCGGVLPRGADDPPNPFPSEPTMAKPANKGKTCTRHRKIHGVNKCVAFGGVSKKRRSKKSKR